ncbi:UNVERIFIED_ORG: glyoxylase-like metal-dependent hydrolase (beta-lactamase superfamily II) [Rhizobium etli]
MGDVIGREIIAFMESPAFDLAFEPAYGRAVPVVSGVERITAENPGPFTFYGTNSYIVGASSVAVIDPGPEDEAHFQALMAALSGREVTHIFVSHTHRDHSPLARRLQAATGADGGPGAAPAGTAAQGRRDQSLFRKLGSRLRARYRAQ